MLLYKCLIKMLVYVCVYIYTYMYTHILISILIFFKVEIYCGLFCYSLYSFVTMEGNNAPPNKKSKRQIQQVLKLIFPHFV
jgi:hypothetical protein